MDHAIGNNTQFQDAVKQFLISKQKIEAVIKQSKSDRENRSRSLEMLTSMMQESNVNYIQVSTSPNKYLVLVDKPVPPAFTEEFLRATFLSFFKAYGNAATCLSNPSNNEAQLQAISKTFADHIQHTRKQMSSSKKTVILTDKKPLAAFMMQQS